MSGFDLLYVSCFLQGLITLYKKSMYKRTYILIFRICARVWVLKLLILIPRSLLIEFSYTKKGAKKEVGNATNENRFCLVSVSDLKIHSY